MLYSYYVGLDLGQSRDYTALCVLEEPLFVPSKQLESGGWAWKLGIERSGWVSPTALSPLQAEEALAQNYHYGRPPDPPLSVRHLKRFELGTPYPRIIEDVGHLLSRGPLLKKRVALLIDKTGVGAAVVDHFLEAGLKPIPITIHGGDTVTREPHGRRGYRVPKRELVAAAQVLLQNGRLKIAAGLSLAETLKTELLNFRVKIDPATAYDSYSHWREADHDDLVLATAMACWFRQYWNRNLDQAFAQNPAVVGAQR